MAVWSQVKICMHRLSLYGL